ncbi:hypothetical protein RDWZM_006571 [Blomia tropicalis]|uniref:Cystatin domain-containing protein n=1 Tax=Blomia tropicalis TaxID=40697 RepID=A0A9Q0M8I3_BLOTA|nr:hypothetical protein RDWZM_006571 [Blomia tropicalis]
MKSISLILLAVGLASAVPTPGEFKPLDVHDTEMLKNLNSLEQTINDRMETIYYNRIGKVNTAEYQIVSGINYHVTFELGQTTCRKSDVNEATKEKCTMITLQQTCEATIWAQSWLKHVELTSIQCKPINVFVADTHKGEPNELDVHDAHLLKALDSATKIINDRLNSPYYHRIRKVIEATQQIVSGINYRVKFELAQTQCLKSEMEGKDIEECNQFTHVQICQVTIWSQPCKGPRIEDLGNSQPQTSQPTAQPNPHQSSSHSGSNNASNHPKKIDEEISELVRSLPFVSSEFDSNILRDMKRQMGRLSSTCKSFGFALGLAIPRGKPKKKYPGKLGPSGKTPGYSDGEPEKLDVHDSNLLKVLESATPLINDRLNSPYYHRIRKAIEATQQIVSGTMYRVKFELGQTQCLKSEMEGKKVEECNHLTHLQTCHVAIWSQPWLNHLELVEIQCVKSEDNNILGGEVRIDVNHPAMLTALHEMEPRISNSINSPFAFKVVKVIEATSQIISGVAYRVKFEWGQTECRKSAEMNDECASRITKTQVCEATIFSRPWLDETTVGYFHCEN